tara:strand:+ start:2012 stop:2212 length:201 start_codon:yes stop_codon:yes gene_type:complete
MKVGDLVLLDIGYGNPYGMKKPPELAIIRGINTDYSPTRYYLTVVSTGKRKWATQNFIEPVEETCK